MSALTALKGLFSSSRAAGSIAHEAEEVEEVGADVTRAAKPGIFSRATSGVGSGLNTAGNVIGAAGTAGQVAMGVAGAGLAYEEFSEIEKFLKFAVQCVEDPKHIGAHFKEMLGFPADPADKGAEGAQQAAATAGVSGTAGSGVAPPSGALGSAGPGTPAPGIDLKPVSATVHLPGQGADKAFALDASKLGGGSFENILGGAMGQTGPTGLSALPAGAIIESQMRGKDGATIHQNVEIIDKGHYRILPGDDGFSQFKKPEGFDTLGYASSKSVEMLELSKISGTSARPTGVVAIAEGSVGGGVTRSLTQGSSVAFGAQMDNGTREGLNVSMIGMGSDMRVSDRESGFFRQGADKPTLGQFEFDGASGVSKLSFATAGDPSSKSLGFTMAKDGRSVIQAKSSVGGVDRLVVSSATGDRMSLTGDGALRLNEYGVKATREVGAASAEASKLETLAGPGLKSSVVSLQGDKAPVQFVDRGDRALAITDGQLIKFEKGGDGRWMTETEKVPGLKLDPKTGAAIVPESAAAEISGFMKDKDSGKGLTLGQPSAIKDEMSPLQRVMAIANQRSDLAARDQAASVAPAKTSPGREFGA